MSDKSPSPEPWSASHNKVTSILMRFKPHTSVGPHTIHAIADEIIAAVAEPDGLGEADRLAKAEALLREFMETIHPIASRHLGLNPETESPDGWVPRVRAFLDEGTPPTTEKPEVAQ